MSARVLVVEDTPANMRLFTVLVHSAGHEVLPARSAEEALELALSAQPQLILMDVQLPGMSGLEATRLLKAGAQTRDIPVVALTAFAMKGDEEKLRAAGCDGYVAKPVQTQRFLEELARWLPQEPRE